MAPRRPTAFEVSFPDEPLAGPSKTPGSVSVRPQKRKIDVENRERSDKRRSLKRPPKACYYTPRRNEIIENAEMVVSGEDTDILYDEDDRRSSDGDKPIRILTDFTFFDPRHRMEMVPLSAIEEDDGNNREFEGAGLVSAYFLHEEDEGQENEIEEAKLQYVRLGAILRYSVDYTRLNDPIYVETQFAWYILGIPSKLYKPFYTPFYTTLRVTQVVIASAVVHHNRSYQTFLDNFSRTVNDLTGECFTDEDLDDAIPHIESALEALDNGDELCTTAILRHLLCHSAKPASRKQGQSIHPRNHSHWQPRAILDNLDLAVLRPENQVTTHVTPFIDTLTSEYVREQFIVVGPPPPQVDGALRQNLHKSGWLHLLLLLKSARRRLRVIEVEPNQPRGKQHSCYLESVQIDNVPYRIGDSVIVRIGTEDGKRAHAPELPARVSEVPESATLSDYFWFGKIIWINSDTQSTHVQWFRHSSTTVLEEVSDSQELFLTNECDTLPLSFVIGKATVCRLHPNNPMPLLSPKEFFYRFVYNKETGSFSDMNEQMVEHAALDQPPNNCPVCLLVEHQTQDDEICSLNNGFSFHGCKYHVRDFVLLRATSGPADIGYIEDIEFPDSRSRRQKTTRVTLKSVGRICDIAGVLPKEVIKDERHLFMTDDEFVVDATEVIGKCHVMPLTGVGNLPHWLSLSPNHFYIRWCFPSLDVQSWTDKKALVLNVCDSCFREKKLELGNTKTFLSHFQRNPLRTLDLFGGVGALGAGMAEGALGGIQVTHAVEISPSAARTYKHNSPHTIVYNQCANVVLRYAIKTHEGHAVDTPLSIHKKTPLAPPPQPGDIDLLCCGFPCQSHSSLNMFKKVDDPKNNLIFTTLAWIDWLRPKFCVFENVRGFLRFNLDATQAGRHQIEGGIEMGGLKIVIRAMLAMSYQVRYGLLQAANYGTPQTRVRFILIAAQQGYPLPEFPQPTHDFALTESLSIKLPTGDIIHPIGPARGFALHPFVTVDDAISDLLRFDWRNPGIKPRSTAKMAEDRERERFIPALECKPSAPYCGYQGVQRYQYEPKTSFQVRSRKEPSEDLQHYTRILIKAKIDRVIHIPLDPKSDYRTLKPDMWEWQFANPSSAVAKSAFRPGLYGRLDKDGWFSTTVTNMDPTAKQSKVLNPYCKRMVTVRELARSQGFPDRFVFKSIDDNIVAMHRQIGNAVPWPVAEALGREIRMSLYNHWFAQPD